MTSFDSQALAGRQEPQGSWAEAPGGPPAAGAAAAVSSDDLRAAHRALSPQDLAFREWALGDPEMCTGDTLHRLCLDYPLLLPREQQAWPTFIGSARRAEIAAMTEHLCRLLREIPRRFFRGDAARMARFYGLASPYIVEMILAPPDGFDESVGRADVLDGPAGLRFIEFNSSVSLGGWDARVIGQLHGAVPSLREYARREGIALVPCDPARAFCRHLIACARRRNLCSGGPLNLAVMIGVSKLAASATHSTSFLEGVLAEVAAEEGIVAGKVVACQYADLSIRASGLSFRGLPVSAIAELEGNTVPPGVYSLYKQGRLVLFNGPADGILANKCNLALLSAAGSEHLDAPDLEFIARTVPWTREVTPGQVTYEGESHRMADLVVANRERLVLKKGISFAGQDVLLGSDTPPRQWQLAVDEALAAGGWVAQEVVQTWPYLYRDLELGCVVHDVNWGSFIFGTRSEGIHVRVRPRGAGLVSVRQGATQSVTFEV